MGDLSAHFSKKEFACKCGCGYGLKDGDVSPELITKLEKLRELCGNKPLTINSGCRCPKHNKAVGGSQKRLDKNGKLTSPGSQHMYGTAADVRQVPGLTIAQMEKLAEQAGFTGIGKYKGRIHVDVRSTAPARWTDRSYSGGD